MRFWTWLGNYDLGKNVSQKYCLVQCVSALLWKRVYGMTWFWCNFLICVYEEYQL